MRALLSGNTRFARPSDSTTWSTLRVETPATYVELSEVEKLFAAELRVCGDE